MSFMAIGVGLVAADVGLTAYGAVEQNKAAKNAASVDTAVAQYNAQSDKAQAQQIDLDTQVNIQTQRQNNAVYLSRQAASYAASGVLATTGSPLHAQVVTAGRMEQQVQQYYVNQQQREQELYAQAAEGVAYGAAAAESDRARGTIALIDGGAKISGQIFDAYMGGAFGG